MKTLVAFEDFSFGAQGWTTTAARAASGSRGVYGPSTWAQSPNVSICHRTPRRFAWPSTCTCPATASGDGFSVRVNGEPRDRGRHAVRVIERRDPAARCGGGITPSGFCSINRAMPCRWRSRRCRDRTHPGRSTTSRSSPRPARPKASARSISGPDTVPPRVGDHGAEDVVTAHEDQRGPPLHPEATGVIRRAVGAPIHADEGDRRVIGGVRGAQILHRPCAARQLRTRDSCTVRMPTVMTSTPTRSHHDSRSPSSAAAMATPKTGLRK